MISLEDRTRCYRYPLLHIYSVHDSTLVLHAPRISWDAPCGDPVMCLYLHRHCGGQPYSSQSLHRFFHASTVNPSSLISSFHSIQHGAFQRALAAAKGLAGSQVRHSLISEPRNTSSDSMASGSPTRRPARQLGPSYQNHHSRFLFAFNHRMLVFLLDSRSITPLRSARPGAVPSRPMRRPVPLSRTSAVVCRESVLRISHLASLPISAV